MKPAVTLGDVWNAELDAFLAARIYEFNASATGHADGRALTATVDDARGRRIAAASGHTGEAPASLTSLWVEESHRRAGLGSALLRAVEDEARRRGCAQVVLLTHDFQATGVLRAARLPPRGRDRRLPAGPRAARLRQADRPDAVTQSRDGISSASA
jgi:GNAT superfamily N-acetyltransferase